jgi:hypothetical protein
MSFIMRYLRMMYSPLLPIGWIPKSDTLKKNVQMDLRTTFKIEPCGSEISHSTPVAFIGSCFASEIAGKMNDGKMTTLVNPAGTVYNPVSISNTVSAILQNKLFTEKDLYKHRDRYISLLHYTNFSSDIPGTLLDRINSATSSAHDFFRNAGFLFVTFGTARVYRLRETGTVVSNCHKMPGTLFAQELLTVDEITDLWTNLLDELRSFNKGLKVIFTISPVRHLKDGAHGNQVSKSVLFLAVEKLLSHPSSGGYFPAYEIIMDDLRDYRYYNEDMLHPSKTAVDYIWKAFSECCLSTEAVSIWKEASIITRAMNHRLITDSIKAKKEFGNEILF